MTVLPIGLSRAFHALHGILLSFPIALFTSAAVTDIAYLRTAEVQWTNFSAWMIAGALLFGGLVAAWALIDLVVGLRGRNRTPRLLYFGVLAVMWLLGLVNAFKHSQDAWSSVGGLGLGLSLLCSLLAILAGAIGFSGVTTREAR